MNISTGIHLLKVNNRNTSVSVANFEHVIAGNHGNIPTTEKIRN